jgi:hypothetical protein
MQSMWKEVVDHWSRVSELDPNREGLARGLAQAKENLALDGALASRRARRRDLPVDGARERPSGSAPSAT